MVENLLITGGAGFRGSHVARVTRLDHHYRARILNTEKMILHGFFCFVSQPARQAVRHDSWLAKPTS
jgi:nucleoside-diphosphate-sugar epimerase